MSLVRKLVSQTATYGISSIVGRFLNYLLTPLYTAVYSAAQYGVVVELYAYTSFFIVVLSYGMETAFFRFSQQDNEKPERVLGTSLWSLLFTSLAFLLVTWIAAPPIADAIYYTGHPEYIRWLGLILAADAIATIPFALLRRQNKAARFSLLRFGNILLNIGLNLFFLVLCPYVLKTPGLSGLHGFVNAVYDPSIGVGYVFISNVISSLAMLPLLWKEFRGLAAGFDWSLWKRMMKYAWPLLFIGLAGMVNETLDRAILKYMLPRDTAMTSLGIYGGCYKLSILMTLFIQAYRFAAEPFFFEQMKSKDARQTYAVTMNYFVAVCCLIFLVVSLYLDFFKLFLRNPKLYEGLDTVPILLLANLFLGVHYNLSVWYKITDRTRTGAWISIFGAVITIALNLSLIPLLGYFGSAWATLVCYASMAVLNYFLGQRHYRVPYAIGKLGAYLFSAVALYMLARWYSGLLADAVVYTLNGLLLVLFTAGVLFSETRNKKINLPGQE